jgi:hypothetical protein
MPALTESTELVSVDGMIDEIASEALKEARHVEEAEKYRKNPGPIVPLKPFEPRLTLELKTGVRKSLRT